MHAASANVRDDIELFAPAWIDAVFGGVIMHRSRSNAVLNRLGTLPSPATKKAGKRAWEQENYLHLPNDFEEIKV